MIIIDNNYTLRATLKQTHKPDQSQSVILMTASDTCKQRFNNINKHRYKSHQSSGRDDRQEKIEKQREGQHVRRITERTQ